MQQPVKEETIGVEVEKDESSTPVFKDGVEKKARVVSPVLVLFIGVLATSSASILIRSAQREAPSLVIAAYRIGLATLILTPITLIRQYQELRSLRFKQVSLLFLSGFFLALHFASWITSLEYTTVASSVVLVTTTPMWVALLSPFVLRERISRVLIGGLVIALTGGVIVSMGHSCQFQNWSLTCPSIQEFTRGRAFSGNMLALAGAWCAGGYLLIGKQLRSSVSILSYTFMVYGFAEIVLLVVVLFTRQPLTGYSPMTYVWFLALAVFPQLLGHSSYNWALAYLPVTYVSVALLAEPVGSTILAYLLLKETPASLEIIGGVLILAGIYLASRSTE